MITPKQAHIGLKKPCKNCPFTKDKQNSVVLSKGRREQIIEDLMTGKSPTFVCHKTVNYSVYLNSVENGQACAGALAVTKQMGAMATIEKVALALGVIDENYFESAMNLSTDNFELGV